jgi:predicted RNA-binding protein YlqC (UPF0109 family)
MTELQAELKSLAHTIISSLVDCPDQIRITAAHGETCTMLEVHVADDDVGKVIGRSGYTATAIRTILSNAAGKYGKSVILEIAEPEHRRRRRDVA